ncbi:peroxisomal targeting signal 2 receptor [Chytriomyces hyalinus]|nr:peroxisomal targeting signal 2 receptor [Chytriomyces hyalinus]
MSALKHRPAPFMFRTTGFQGYAVETPSFLRVEFSPFFENRLACASAANFGIAGNGRLWAMNVSNEGIAAITFFDTQDGLYDCAWSEVNENQIVASSGDGSIKLFDLGLRDFPILNLHEHTREVFSVKWNLVRKDTFVSGSWDHQIKIWSPESNVSLMTWKEHTSCVYQTAWSPHVAERFASASGDSTVKIWDVRSPRSSTTFRAHASETLALDWNKYDPYSIVTAGVDHAVRVWDLRNTSKDVLTLRGHEYAVRRVKCSPHSKSVVASTSYDMTMRVWETSRAFNNLVQVHDLHSEFVLGVDFNMFVPGQVATCAWDELVHVFPVVA